jgi:hypothetical protein
VATTGKYLQATLANALFHKGVQKWNSEPSGEELDDADAETNGYESWDTGLVGVKITIDFLWDTADGPIPVLKKGTLLTDLRAFANRNQATPDLYLPLARVMKRPRMVEVRGQIKGSIEVRNVGQFYEDGATAG